MDRTTRLPESGTRSSAEPATDSLAAFVATVVARHRDAVTLYDQDGIMLTLNESGRRLRFLCDWDAVLATPDARDALTWAYRGGRRELERRVRSIEGELRLHISFVPTYVDGVLLGVLEIVRDLYNGDVPEGAFEGASGLPTAAILHDRIARALASCRRFNRTFALHMISVAIDDDDENSDSEMLRSDLRRIGLQRLLAAVRRVDTVARHGRGFVVLQVEVNQEGSDRLVARLHELFAIEAIIGGRSRALKLRIGTMLVSDEHESVDELLSDVDLALCRAETPRLAALAAVEQPQYERRHS